MEQELELSAVIGFQGKLRASWPVRASRELERVRSRPSTQVFRGSPLIL